MTKQYIFPSLLIATGLALAGYLIGEGIYKTKALDRHVTVKGLAEREVDANLAIWPILFTETSNDLVMLQSRLADNTNLIIDFLKKKGFTDDEISVGTQSLTDFLATQYYDQYKQRQYRYVGKGNLTIRTQKVELVVQSLSNISELIGKGVVLEGGEYYHSNVQYLYTKLNSIKPEMIEEATVNARKSAVKFADDSGSKVGKIKIANQGLFSISDRDYNSPHKKKIRVVTTIDYYLED